jgi:hypothetical protein
LPLLIGGGVLMALVLGRVVMLLLTPEPPPPSIPDAEWKEFSDRQGGFQVLMPGTPVSGDYTLPGFRAELTMFAVERRDGTFFAVAYVDLEKAFLTTPVEDILNGAHRQGLSGYIRGASRKGERWLTVHGIQVRELELKTPDRKGLLIRSLLVQNRQYHLLARGPRYESSSPDVSTFFDSFQLTAGQR